MTTNQHQLINQGRDALAQSNWDEARSLFARAIADDETAAAHEGMSWAAWWLSDSDCVIAARKAAYRLYLAAGDNLGAARMALWLSVDFEDFRGAVPIAQGWRHRARRLLDPIPIGSEHGLLALVDAESTLWFEDDLDTALDHAGVALSRGTEAGDTDVTIMALALQGLILVGSGQIETGMAQLDEAAASALGGELRETLWVNRIMCYLLFACDWVRDVDRAAHWCKVLRDLANQSRSLFEQGICRAHYAGVLIARGEWAEAEQHLAGATAILQATRPIYGVEAVVRLGELRRRQGQLDEASAFFRQVEWHPQALLGSAAVALDHAKPHDAREFVGRFLRHMPESNAVRRAAALELLVRIESLLGNQDQAAEALAALQAVSEAVRTLPLRAATSFSAGLLARASGYNDLARMRLEDAVSLSEQAGTPFEAAQARLELAAVLLSLGRLERAQSEAATAHQTFARLGSRHSADQARALLQEIGQRLSAIEPGHSTTSGLTPRHREILRCVARGMGDREIAAALNLSEHTIHRHIANILLRLDLPTRAAAVAHAVNHGLI